MASAEDCRIQVKHILIAVIVILSAILLIASIVLITIGYLNPFGTVGLGILGGGCVLYFAAILFLCASSIWVKNKYYPDGNDIMDKGTPSHSEDISLLKPALNMTSPARNEDGHINDTECYSDDKMVPLCSVSTLYSVSSTASTVPDKTMLCNWQGGDADGALDGDVFSSSLTGMQHADMKLQEKLKLKRGSTEQINCETASEWKIKDLEKRKIADLPILYSTGKSVSDTPYQRNPVVMDIVRTTYSSAEEKRLLNHHISGQSKEGNYINPNPQISGRSNMSVMPPPMEDTRSSAAPIRQQHIPDLSKQRYESKGAEKYNQECKPVLEKRRVHAGEKDNQTPDRHWSVISANDSWIHNPRVESTSKGLKTVRTATSEAEKLHTSCERLDKISKEKTKVPLQNLLPNTWLDQPERLQWSQMTSENLGAKGKVTTKPGMRKGF